MVWLLPAALVGLAAVAGPLIVHLLRRQRARTLIVPTVRFVPRAHQSVARMRVPSDAWLLALRMAIIACAALALARPLLLTEPRAAAWAGRIARVVIVDDRAAAVPASAAVAAAELQSATYGHRIDSTKPGPALRRAAAWLEAAPPARREIVLLSTFPLGALTDDDVQGVPDAIGFRLVRMRGAVAAASRDFRAAPVLSDAGLLQRHVRIDETTTGVEFVPGAGTIEGLRLLTAARDAGAASALLRVVSRAGAFAPSSAQPVVVRFPGGEPLPSGAGGAAEEWTSEAALRLLQTADATDLPLTAAAGAGALLVDVQAAPDTLAAAQALKAALDARVDPAALAAQEVATIPEPVLKRWTREPGAADPTRWRQSDESDGRWLWLLALVLLAVESVARRAPKPQVREAEANAA